MTIEEERVSPEIRSSLVDEVSARVQRAFPRNIWSSLFAERTGSLKFGSVKRTVLCVECPPDGPMTRAGVVAALSRTAPRHRALLDPCADAYAFLSFSDPKEALRMGVALQRMMPGARLRMGIASGLCQMGLCQVGETHFVVLLGWQRAHAEALTARASPGTIQLEPPVYVAVQDCVANELGSCVLMSEYDGAELAEVSLTLPPDRSEALSTFAGLGLT